CVRRRAVLRRWRAPADADGLDHGFGGGADRARGPRKVPGRLPGHSSQRRVRAAVQPRAGGPVVSYLADRITRSPEKSYGMAGRTAALSDPQYIHMELGRPCHDTPELIKEATIKALRAGKVHYSDF